MLSWEDCPESSGPVTESAAGGYGAVLDTQALADHSIRLPQLDAAELAQGRYVPVSGPIPYLPSVEQRDRERAEADRLWERRQVIERAAIQAGQAALGGRRDR